jgi:hypothetical protein
MERIDLEKITPDGRGSLILSSKFQCLAGFTNEQKNNKPAGGICYLPLYEGNFEWWRMSPSPLKGLISFNIIHIGLCGRNLQLQSIRLALETEHILKLWH